MGELTSQKDPVTREEWQRVVNDISVLMLIDSARQYGLITGGPVPDMKRCDDLLLKAKQLGIQPTPIAGLVPRTED